MRLKKQLLGSLLVVIVVLSIAVATTKQQKGFVTGQPTGALNLSDILDSEELGEYHLMSAAIITGNTVDFSGLGAGPDDPFEIASITKIFTGELLRLQIERGEITESTAVGDVLGERVADSLIRDITVEELANHTSGLPRLGNVGLRPFMATFFDKNPYKDLSADRVISISTTSKLNSRGEFHYSNLGFALLGQVLARNAGLTFNQLLDRDLLAPLNLNNTKLMTPESLAQDAPQGFSTPGKQVEAWEMDGFLPAAGLRSTARDMAVFCQYLFTKGPAPFTWQSLESAPEIIWHNGESFGYSSVLFFNTATTTAIFVAADVATSVFPIGHELLMANSTRQESK
ncbi:serine hydrolase domain-containing protein [Corynebacterium glutamicum]|uniref:serine hydrolase domain-containing protein n=1 Tax=Corynebacterium glutamicum TaxID=1718 RepID=UPI00117D0380|nr:serine hydrolase [Corynebacterium glutamicum]QDQ22613.1 serine hydrolase [Corynebacterium glutamicum]